MTAGIEIEVKLSVIDPERVRRLVEVADPVLLAGFRAKGELRQIVVIDRYLDTADGRLSSLGIRLRTRETDGDLVVALKRSGVDDGAITARVELEGIATSDRDPATWPDSAARRELIATGVREPLVETAVLRQRRAIRDVARGETLIELSLDELEALDGSEVVATRWELEAELRAGDREDLRDLADALASNPGIGPPAGQKRLFAIQAVAAARAAVPSGPA